MKFIEKYARVDGSEDEDNSVADGDKVTTYSDAKFSDDNEETNVQEQSSTDLIVWWTLLETCKKSCSINQCLPTSASALTLKIFFLTT